MHYGYSVLSRVHYLNTVALWEFMNAQDFLLCFYKMGKFPNWFVLWVFCFDCVFSVIPHSSWRTALRAQLPCDRIPFLCPPVGSGHWRDAVWTERDGHLRGWDVSGRRDESLIHMCTWMSLAARSVIIYSHFSESDYLTRESFGSRTTHRRTKFAMYIGQRFLFVV